MDTAAFGEHGGAAPCQFSSPCLFCHRSAELVNAALHAAKMSFLTACTTDWRSKRAQRRRPAHPDGAEAEPGAQSTVQFVGLHCPANVGCTPAQPSLSNTAQPLLLARTLPRLWVICRYGLKGAGSIHNLYCFCGWESSNTQLTAWTGPKEDVSAGDHDPSRCRLLWGHPAFPRQPQGVIPSLWE